MDVKTASPALSTFRKEIGKRLIFVGDIHGCYDELRELLAILQPETGDILVSLGDVVRKGPFPDHCLDLWREREYLAVLGNNEKKLLDRATNPLRRIMPGPDGRVLRRRDLVEYMSGWPLVVDFPHLRVSAVHGGFLPGTTVSADSVERQRDFAYRLRFVRKKGRSWEFVPKGEERKGDSLWSDVYDGDRFVVYGHTPVREPRMDERSLGLDTGCVYGGQLTAAVLSGKEWTTVSVNARHAYSR
jgi:predicted phosphodiesterase